MRSGTAIIRADNLVKKFGGLTAVDGISFEIRPGECFGFLGPNGAGKTTTVRMIHCVSPVTAGSLSIAGRPVTTHDRRLKKTIGVIPQEIDLDSDLTVYENLAVFAWFFDIRKKEAARRIDALLKFVELEGRLKARIRELSTGMKRRLLIARALLNEPEIVVADEPTTGLDPQARHLVWQRLRQLKGRGVTLVLTTQYMEEAQQLCDRLVVMDHGKILKEGTPAGLIEEEIGREVIEIRVPRERDREIIARLDGEAMRPERVGDTLYLYCRDGRDIMKKLVELDIKYYLERPATLEDVFLKLTGRSLFE